MPASIAAPRCFAIIPAAGRSRRMGRNKLMLDWKGAPLLEHALGAWQMSRVSKVLVVVRSEDTAVRAVCARRRVETLCPERAPEDMKESIQHALRKLAASDQPRPQDRFLIAPADLPKLTSELIDRVVEASTSRSEIVLPRFGDRRGHPVSLPWTLAPSVFDLAADEGINRIVACEAVFHVDLPREAAMDDIDTPADYRRLRENLGEDESAESEPPGGDGDSPRA